jgi:hypothetical protein
VLISRLKSQVLGRLGVSNGRGLPEGLLNGGCDDLGFNERHEVVAFDHTHIGKVRLGPLWQRCRDKVVSTSQHDRRRHLGPSLTHGRDKNALMVIARLGFA